MEEQAGQPTGRNPVVRLAWGLEGIQAGEEKFSFNISCTSLKLRYGYPQEVIFSAAYISRQLSLGPDWRGLHRHIMNKSPVKVTYEGNLYILDGERMCLCNLLFIGMWPD